MPSRFYPNDYGPIIFSNDTIWQRVGSVNVLPDTPLEVGDESNIPTFTYNVADINGKTEYSSLERTISKYKLYTSETEFTLLDTEYPMLTAPLFGIVRVWANLSGVKFFVDSVEHVADAPTSEVDAVPIQLLQGQVLSVSANATGREGYMTFLPYQYPIP